MIFIGLYEIPDRVSGVVLEVKRRRCVGLQPNQIPVSVSVRVRVSVGVSVSASVSVRVHVSVSVSAVLEVERRRGVGLQPHQIPVYFRNWASKITTHRSRPQAFV